MAKGRTYTLRGCFPWKSITQATVMTPIRVPLWNGSWTKNWVVDKVEVIITGTTTFGCHQMTGGNMISLVIATEKNGAIPDFSAPGKIAGLTVRDNRQIWWSTMAPNSAIMSVLDPDHLFVQDLWINGWYNDDDTCVRYALEQEIGYVITLKETKTSISQAVLSLIKEQAQDTPE